MAKPPPEPRDKLGRVLSVREYVAYADANQLRLGTIVKINPKMLRIKGLGASWEINKYSVDTIRIEGPDLTMYLLTK
jgi:hypothetical protein